MTAAARQERDLVECDATVSWVTLRWPKAHCYLSQATRLSTCCVTVLMVLYCLVDIRPA